MASVRPTGDHIYISGLTGWNGTNYYQVLDATGRQVISGTPFYQDAGFTAALTGTYTLLMEGRYYATTAAPYGFTVSKVVNQTAALTLNTETDGTLTAPGQQATYNFHPGQRVRAVLPQPDQ